MKKYALTFLCLLLMGMIVAGCTTVHHNSSETVAESSTTISEPASTVLSKETTTSSQISSAVSNPSFSSTYSHYSPEPIYSEKIPTVSISSMSIDEMIEVFEKAFALDLPESFRLNRAIVDFKFSQSEYYGAFRTIDFNQFGGYLDNAEEAHALISRLNNDSEWVKKDRNTSKPVASYETADYEKQKDIYYEKVTEIPHVNWFNNTQSTYLPSTVTVRLIKINTSFLIQASGTTYNHTNYEGNVKTGIQYLYLQNTSEALEYIQKHRGPSNGS